MPEVNKEISPQKGPQKMDTKALPNGFVEVTKSLNNFAESLGINLIESPDPFDLFSKALSKNEQLKFTEDNLKDLFELEKDPSKVIEFAKEIESFFGFAPMPYTIIESFNEYRSITNLKAAIEKIKKMDIGSDGVSFIGGHYEFEKLAEMITVLKGVGIKDNFRYFYGLKFSPQNIKTLIELGLGDSYHISLVLKDYDGDVSKFLEKEHKVEKNLLDLGYSRTYILDVYSYLGNVDIDEQDLIEFAKDLKSKNLTSFQFYRIFKESSDGKKVVEFLNLSPIGESPFDADKIINMTKVKGDPASIVNFFNIAEENKIRGIAEFYEAESDIMKVVAYVKTLRGISDPVIEEFDIYKLIKIEPSVEVIEKNKKNITELSKTETLEMVFRLIGTFKNGDRSKFDKEIPLFMSLGLDRERAELAYFIFCDDSSPFDSSKDTKLLDREEFFPYTFSMDLAFDFVKILKKADFKARKIISFSKLRFPAEYIVEAYAFEKQYHLGIIPKESTPSSEDLNAVLDIEKAGGNINFIALAKYIYKGNFQASGENLKIFLEEPALPFCAAVYGNIHNEEESLKIGRNFYLSGMTLEELQSLSSDQIYDKYLATEELKREYGDTHIFKGRNVLIMGNNEELWDGEDARRFVPKEMLKEIEASIGGKNPSKKIQFIKAERNASDLDLENIRKRVLYAIANTPPPFTFVFDGHGKPDGLYYTNDSRGSDDKMKSGEYISADEFAAALSERAIHFPEKRDALSKDIYIFSSCFNHNFLRKVLEKNKGVQPIMMGESEYGQYSFTPHSWNENAFKTVIGAGKKDDTISRIIKNEEGYKKSNFTVYVPNNGVPQQIVKSDKNRSVNIRS